MADRKPEQSIDGDHNIQAGGDVHLHYAPASPPEPASLARVIRKLSEMLHPPPNNRPLEPFDVKAKIDANDVVAYRDHLEEYATYSKVVEGAYEALARASYPKGRLVIQRHLRSLYLNLRAQHCTASSDHILTLLIADLKKLAGSVQGVSPDELGYCCDMLVAHAFVECTVLERPKC